MGGGARYWQSLSTKEFSCDVGGGEIAVLPVSAIEQHGPHLPLDVDAAINEAVLSAALENLPASLSVLVLPPQAIGYSEEHGSFPGTLTLKAETILSLWREIGECVARAGVRKLVIFNSHGGQNELMAIAARQLRASCGMLVVTAGWSRLCSLVDLFDADELKYGIHGGAVETSIMLHIAPGRVRMDEAADFHSRGQDVAENSAFLGPTGRNAYGWMTEDLNESGAVGNAAAADAALGAEALARAAKGLLALLDDVNRMPVPEVQES